MRIAIVGSGYFGCHSALICKELGHEIVIFEKEKDIFTGASGHSQNRFHLGFHYPRSDKTRNQIKSCNAEFLKRYGFAVKFFPSNIYAVAKDSCLDFGTYCKIYHAEQFDVVEPEEYDIENVEGAISCGEGLVDTDLIIKYFKEKLCGNFRFNEKVQELYNIHNGVVVNGEKFDWAIVATYNQDWPDKTNVCYEAALMLLYKKTKLCKFEALTIVDGPYCSVFPYHDDLYTLSSVRNTPFGVSKKIEEIQKLVGSPLNVDYFKLIFESEIEQFIPYFSDRFQYVRYLTAIKTKPYVDNAAHREFCSHVFNRIIRLYSGKINNIIMVEKVIKDNIEL